MKFKLISRKGNNNSDHSSKTKSPVGFKRKIYYSVLVVGVALLVTAALIFVYRLIEEGTARDEYETVRELFFGSVPAESEGNIPADTDDFVEEIETLPYEEAESLRLNLEELFEINNDFIGWISIGGLIEYPVVRGNDNHRYINTTFMGERNPAGAIFMDYRNTQGFDETISVLYGHLTRDRTMFSELHRFRDSNFLAENPYIEITTLGGDILVYQVFAAIVTDVWNPAYTLSFTNTARAISGFPNTPRDADRFMLLSTCTLGPDDDERLLVFAAFAE